MKAILNPRSFLDNSPFTEAESAQRESVKDTLNLIMTKLRVYYSQVREARGAKQTRPIVSHKV